MAPRRRSTSDKQGERQETGMSGAIETIPAQLRSMFLPQVEQIGADMCARGCGIQAQVSNDLCMGTMWMASVGSDCLVSMHRLTPRRRFHMDECSEHDAMHVAFLSAPAAKCLSDVSAPNMCRPRLVPAGVLSPLA